MQSAENSIEIKLLDLPKEGFGVVTVRPGHGYLTQEFLTVLTNRVAQINPQLVVVGLAPGAAVEKMTDMEAAYLMSTITNHLTVADLKKLGLQRVVN